MDVYSAATRVFQRLIERTRARGELLAKKMAETETSPKRKRTTPLAENNELMNAASPSKSKPNGRDMFLNDFYLHGLLVLCFLLLIQLFLQLTANSEMRLLF